MSCRYPGVFFFFFCRYSVDVLQIFVHRLQIFCRYFSMFLLMLWTTLLHVQMVWGLHVDTVQISCRYCVDNTQISCRYHVDIVQIFCRYSVDILNLFVDILLCFVDIFICHIDILQMSFFFLPRDIYILDPVTSRTVISRYLGVIFVTSRPYRYPRDIARWDTYRIPHCKPIHPFNHSHHKNVSSRHYHTGFKKLAELKLFYKLKVLEARFDNAGKKRFCDKNG